MALKTQKAEDCSKAHFKLSIPPIGKSRWEQLRYIIPVSRETWRKLCKAGKAPHPERISLRCTVWDNAEIHNWLHDPVGYQAKPVGAVNE